MHNTNLISFIFDSASQAVTFMPMKMKRGRNSRPGLQEDFVKSRIVAGFQNAIIKDLYGTCMYKDGNMSKESNGYSIICTFV